MSENRYALAGWLSIAGAILFVVSIVVGILQAVIAGKAFGYHGPVVGPADAVSILFTAFAVYALIMFRRLLHERYEYHGVDTLITLAIVWSIVFQVGAVMLGLFMMVFGIQKDIVVLILSLGFLSVAMLSIGIIDILMSIKLLQARVGFGDLIKVFAYVGLASGILEVSILLSPLALLVVPASFVLLGMILLRDNQPTEFV
jgi:hypothetical protein